MNTKTDAQKASAAKKGNPHWTQTKLYLELASNRKCWYTESKNPGCLNDVEHYRPKGKVLHKGNLLHWYWFLAFNPINYRLSAQIPNRLNNNPLNAKSGGGKGEHFPLLNGTLHGTNLAGTYHEQPALLDPCNQNDIQLLAFNPDGRPTVAPQFSGDPIAIERVEKSNLFLNLDYPTFNEDRESLYNRIRDLVDRGDEYFSKKNVALNDTIKDLIDLMEEKAAYSGAAECYIRCFRDRSWIDELFG